MGSESKLAVGHRAEQQGLDYLVNQGLAYVTRNFHCRGGEIDLVMLDRRSSDVCLVFVEVRFRSRNAFAAAAETIDWRKQDRLVRAAALFIARNRRFRNLTVRFDVIAIDDDDAVQWLQDAFRPVHSNL